MKAFNFLYQFFSERKHLAIKAIIIFILAWISISVSHALENPDNLFIVILDIIAIPFIIVSHALKKFALLSDFTNYISILLLFIIGFFPLFFKGLIMFKGERPLKDRWLDLLFYVILSGLLTYTLYIFINPILIYNPIQDLGLPTNEETDVYVVFIQRIYQSNLIFLLVGFTLLYIFLHFYRYVQLNKLSLKQATSLLIWINKLTHILISLYIYFFLPIFIYHTSKGVKVVVAFETIITYLIEYLVFVLILIVIRTLYHLLQNLHEDHLFVLENIDHLKSISHFYFLILILTLSSNLLVNFYKMLFIRQYTDIHFNFEFPIYHFIMAIIFYLVALIMQRAYEIYTDNQLTI